MSGQTETIEKAVAAAVAARKRKGQSLSVINVEGICSYADAIVIASAGSDRQAMAIARAVEDDLREGFGDKPMSREGSNSWLLIDYGDFIVHVMTEESRAYYAIDQLWADAERVAIPQTEVAAEVTAPTALARRSGL